MRDGWRVDVAALENNGLAPFEKNIDGPLRDMPPLQEDALGTEFEKQVGGILHLVKVRDGINSQNITCLLRVGGDDFGKREKKIDHSAHGASGEKACPAFRHHDGIEDEMCEIVFRHFFRDNLDDLRGGEHSHLCGGYREISANRIELAGDEIGGDGVCRMDPPSILGGEGSYDGRSKNAEGRECFKICLYAGPPA